MKAVQHVRYAPVHEAVEIVDLPDPEPGPGEIVIAMEASAVHLADVCRITGLKGYRSVTLPTIPGYEGVGRVQKVGAGVTALKPGDRVFPWWDSGTFAQLVRTSAETALPAPEGDAQQLALTVVNGMTAVVLLEDFRNLKAGDWLVQNGANSNCGRYLIALAHQRGIRTCNIVRRPAVADELRALGADAVVLDSPDGNELAARVREATGGAPIGIGFDMVGGTATARIVRCIADGGVVVNYGYIAREPCIVHFNELFGKDVAIVGMSTSRGMKKRSMDQIRTIYANLGALIAKGVLRAAIAAAYPLERAVDALEQAWRTGTARDGKVIILPNG